MSSAVCICVPVRNEAERIETLLAALARQRTGRPLKVALCVNNSDDSSAACARAFAERHRHRLDLTIVEMTFPPQAAHAGSARRAAMDLGVELLADNDGVLVSTDADCRPPQTWVSAILAAMSPNRIVGGRIILDEREPLDPSLWDARRRLDRYWRQVRAIEDAIDPCPWDPPPRHGDHTGASLAMTVRLYRQAGGVPLLPTGEDRALVDAARAAGGRLVHPATVWTRTSARLSGRAEGGMAADLHRLLGELGTGAAHRVPDFAHWRARAEWRRQMRPGRCLTELLRLEQALAPMPCDMRLGPGR